MELNNVRHLEEGILTFGFYLVTFDPFINISPKTLGRFLTFKYLVILNENHLKKCRFWELGPFEQNLG